MPSVTASALYPPNAVNVEAAILRCMTDRGKTMRPRVFVSSVMDGFEEYRRAAKVGIIAAGGEPVLVEDFSSLSQSPRTACLDAVASCDIYITVVGSRGGWTAPSGKLVVEEEYEEARHRRLFILAFIQDTERDADAQRLVRKFSDYIDGGFRTTFTTPAILQAAVEKALGPIIQHRIRPEVHTSVIEERLKAPHRIGNEASLRFVLVPERDDELIDPVLLESPELRQQLYDIGHSLRVGLFSYERPKTAEVGPIAIIIHQSDEGRHRNGIDEVRLELTTRGSVIIDLNVTGRAGRNHRDLAHHIFAILEEDIITALRRCFTFARDFLDAQDPYKRYDRLHYNVALSGIGYRTLMGAPSPTGSYTMNQHDREVVLAFDQPRVITRGDFSSPEDQATAVLALLRRRLK